MGKKETIKARLRTLYPKANLSTDRLNALADKLSNFLAEDADETAIDTKINEMNSFTSFEDIAKEDDRIRTLEAGARKALTGTPAGGTPPANEPPTDDVPAWAKSFLDQTKKISEDLEDLKTGKVIETKKATALEFLNKSEVLKNLKPEIKQNWLNRFDLNSETPLEDQVKDLETEYTEIRQNLAVEYGFSGPPASNGSSDLKPSKEEITNLVDNLII